jgi:hypothetical protein
MTVIGLNKIYREEKAKIEAFESGENPLNAHDISEIKVKLASTLEKMNQLAKRDIQAPMAFALAIPTIPKLIGRCDVLLSRIPSDTPITSSSGQVAESSIPAPSSEFSPADYTPSKVYAKVTERLHGQPRTRIGKFDSIAKQHAAFNERKGAAPEIKTTAQPKIESSSIAASSQPIPLPTLITIQYPARLGEHLYIRGEGSGFTWGQKVPLISVDANTWQLRQPMQGEFKFKILLNNEEWETGNDHPANGGDAVSATPVFASQAEKRAEASSLTRVSFFYQPADGETLEVRDSLHDWSAGIELKDMGNGMWVWETDKAAGEFDFKLVRRQGSGDIIWEGGDNRKMQPGTIELIEPRF